MNRALLLALLAAPRAAEASFALGEISAVSFDAAAPAPSVSGRPAGQGPLFPAGLWESLGAPPAAALALLTRRVPGLDAASVREMPFEQADALARRAEAAGLSGMDLFTDPALLAARVYYLSPETLAKLFARYDLIAAIPFSGKSPDGRPFEMQAMTFGAGRVEVVYDRDGIAIASRGAELLLDGRVEFTIGAGSPEQLDIAGIAAHARLAGFISVTARITRLVRKSATLLTVVTDKGSRDILVSPLKRN